jgi:hypothetical protein
VRPTVRWATLRAALKEAWPTWLAIVGIVSAFTLGSLSSTSVSGTIRYAGTILQLMGLATIAYGLREMRRLFKRPSLFAWFRRLGAAFKAPKPIVVQPSAAEVTTASDRARVVLSVGPGVPLEERVKVIEENLNRLRDDLDTKTEEIRRELSTVKDGVQRESQERQAAEQRTVRQIEEVAIGGLHLEIVGLGVCATERFFHETISKSGMNEPFQVNFSGEKVCASMISMA